MMYMLIGHFRRGAAAAAGPLPARSLSETAGLTLIGSWVEASLGRSFHVVDCENLATVQPWAARWRHRVHFEFVPILPAQETVTALEPLLG
jgi:hypothetical protein